MFYVVIVNTYLLWRKLFLLLFKVKPIIFLYFRKSSKRLRILQDTQEEAEEEEENDSKEIENLDSLTQDELKALELYRAMKKKKDSSNIEEASDESDVEQTNLEEEDDEEEKDAGNDERRSITYKMEKNKGLTPKRSKVQRNPRVKHRQKFARAKVRRKGQVREVRTEVQKYGGEFSGINARVKKGIKLA